MKNVRKKFFLIFENDLRKINLMEKFIIIIKPYYLEPVHT